MNTLRVLVSLLVIAVIVSEAKRLAAPADRRKHLAGPPEEMPEHVLPSPVDQHLKSNGALIPAFLADSPYANGESSWTFTFPVDTTTLFTLSVFSPIEDVQIHFQTPTRRLTAATELLAKENIVKETGFGLDGHQLPSTTYVFENPQMGQWTVVVSAPTSAAKAFLGDTLPEAYILMAFEAPHSIFTYLRSYNLEVGEEVAVDALMSAQSDGLNNALAGIVESAKLEMIDPDGVETDLDMHDDGSGNDLAANDGIYVATLKLTEPGSYSARVEMRGKTPDGVEFLRTSQHLFAVVNPELRLDGTATASEANDVIQLHLGAKHDAENAEDQTYYVYAEVWGTNEQEQLVPVAWVGGMTDVIENVLTLNLDKNWLIRAQAAAPLELRGVYVQDRYSHTPLSQIDSIPVANSHMVVPLLTELNQIPYNGEISEQMLWGKRPAFLQASNATNEAGKVILVHGYCTASPGPFTASDFPGAAIFQDFSANRKIDEFANMVLQYGEQFSKFSIVSHSQGGLVGVHLHSFYWSKLEANAANGGRILQSVGSPYAGTALAGNLALIGDVFGVGCGKNAEMTRDGAALWLSTLPASGKDDVYYYITHYSQSGLIHYCNMAANAVLSWPNDGTTEVDYNHLNGGNFMGVVKGWCHSTSMHNPPQCTDSVRNKEMNANAAK